VSGIGSTFHSLSSKTIKTITAIADRDIKNRRAFDVLAKEVFFSRGCVLVEGYEDAHLLQKYFDGQSMPAIEIFGYGSGGADGIVAWLAACSDLQIPAVGLFDGDAKGNAALETAKNQFKDVATIKLLQILTPDIRDKHKLAADCKTETVDIEKEGIFTKDWVLKEKYVDAMNTLAAEISDFLKPENEIPSLTPPANIG
jgi:predicted ATP-dependent endonuclease of OLD family